MDEDAAFLVMLMCNHHRWVHYHGIADKEYAENKINWYIYEDPMRLESQRSSYCVKFAPKVMDHHAVKH